MINYGKYENWSQKKKLILARANYKCEKCGKIKYLNIYNKRKLDFHEDDKPKFLICLCYFCYRAKKKSKDPEVRKAQSEHDKEVYRLKLAMGKKDEGS